MLRNEASLLKIKISLLLLRCFVPQHDSYLVRAACLSGRQAAFPNMTDQTKTLTVNPS